MNSAFGYIFAAALAAAGPIRAQQLAEPCSPPLCVSRIGDRAANPEPGTLRYAVREAPPGAIVRFDPALNGQTIELDSSSPDSQIRIARDVVIQGPGAGRLTIGGRRATRLFLIEGGSVRLAGLTLADGLAKGAGGASGTGGAGGGGGAAGIGGAILLQRGALVLEGVVLRGNRAEGGDGGSGGSSFSMGRGGSGAANTASGEPGGAGGAEVISGIDGGDGSWGAGGGGGGFSLNADGGSGGPGGASAFAGGSGGAGGFLDADGNLTRGAAGNGGAGLGGAIFVRSGLLQLVDTVFTANTAAGGSGGAAGMAKGGALFVCSRGVCGSGDDAAAIWSGKTSFQGNRAADAGGETAFPGRDDADVCGHLSFPVPTHLFVMAPPAASPGEPFMVAISALDSANNIVQTYSGAVHLTSSDPRAALPPDAELSGGAGSFSLTLNSIGTQTVSATVTTAPSVTGVSNPIPVTPDGSPAKE